MQYKIIKEMEKSNFVLNLMKTVFWVVLVMLILTTVVMAAVFVMSLFKINSETINHIKISLPNFKGKFSDLKGYGTVGFSIVMFLITFFCAAEAYLVSKVIKILQKVNLQHPFSEEIAGLIEKVSVLALVLGISSIFINALTGFLIGESTVNFELSSNNFSFLIFAGIIYIIGKIYKKGVDLQNENELTI